MQSDYLLPCASPAMTAVIALKAKAEGGPALKCQVMFWPVTDANFETESYNQYDEGYFLTKPMMKWFWDAYTTDPKQRKEIYASPLQATIEQLKDLPPAMVQTAGNDVPNSGRAGGIRTHDLLNPIQAHYQAVLRPDAKESQDAAPKRRFQAGKAPIQQETIPDSGLNHCGSWWRRPPIPGRAPVRPRN
jgi:alpha/beta hydrolase fold